LVFKQSQSGNTNTSPNPAAPENPFLKLLLKYVETLEDGELRKAVCKPYLQELENKSIKERHCRADVYAFYRVRSMTEEAEQFKAKAIEAEANTVGSTLPAEFEKVENDYVSGVLRLKDKTST
jgi:hypothetical protein